MDLTAPQPVVAIEDKALARILAVRDREPDAEHLGLVITIAGIGATGFEYEMALMRTDDAAPGDHIDEVGGLPVIIPAGDIGNLRGARLGVSRDLLEPGLVLDNPNSPSPAVRADAPPPDLTGPVADRVVRVVDEVLNPAIASHGGFVEVAGVEEGVVYVRLGGGCQGCGMATVTLTQGIESTLRTMVPEITRVVDVTDHAGGTNPYYEQAKK